MRKKGTKILTGFRMEPDLKKMAVKAAFQENRTFSNYIENLIRKDLEEKGIIRTKS